MPNKALFLILILVTSFLKTNAQYRKSMQDYYYKKVIHSNRFWHRMSIGSGKHYLSGKINMKYEGWDITNNDIYKKELNEKARVKRNWTGYIGSYFPVTIVSDNSMLVVNTELMVSMASLIYDSLVFLGTNKYAEDQDAYKLGALISMEYRLGGDITLNKKDAAIFTIGLGVNPCIVNSDDYDIIVPYKFIPFLKAELGFFAGIACKIRGIMYFGNSVYADKETTGISNTGVGDHLKTYISGTNGLDLAIVLMPFSYKWNDQKW